MPANSIHASPVDVQRRTDGTIRSRGDPFWGHHFACRPFTSVATSSPVRPETSQIDYVEYSGADEEFLHEHEQTGSRWEEGCSSLEHAPFIGASSRVPELTAGTQTRKNYRRSQNLPRCHLCYRVLPSTILLVQHLLRHVKSTPNCRCCRTNDSDLECHQTLQYDCEGREYVRHVR
ncbi:hypothetical protein TELCIR_04770 [Teladorsagia circumcincta]|uniref:C2H2-type domain-containing protein n=1 Tax=Teladorsagia circumcincta TaxID=45464 RepID=A0A2G9USX9_TELCI|nr:hypothetical protein TELCIR_04770 [Teladorsagia circumcincta]